MVRRERFFEDLNSDRFLDRFDISYGFTPVDQA